MKKDLINFLVIVFFSVIGGIIILQLEKSDSFELTQKMKDLIERGEKQTKASIEKIRKMKDEDIKVTLKNNYVILEAKDFELERFYHEKDSNFTYDVYYRGFRLDDLSYEQREEIFNEARRKTNFINRDDPGIKRAQRKQRALDELVDN